MAKRGGFPGGAMPGNMSNLMKQAQKMQKQMEEKTKLTIIIFIAEGELFMFRLWAKVFKENRMVKDILICNDNPEENRTKKIFQAIDDICYEFDLSKPIWLDSTIADFRKHDKTRFTKDNFIDFIDFDYLEIHVIEED